MSMIINNEGQIFLSFEDVNAYSFNRNAQYELSFGIKAIDSNPLQVTLTFQGSIELEVDLSEIRIIEDIDD